MRAKWIINKILNLFFGANFIFCVLHQYQTLYPDANISIQFQEILDKYEELSDWDSLLEQEMIKDEDFNQNFQTILNEDRYLFYTKISPIFDVQHWYYYI
jgi:hypothetical protein